MHGQKSIKQGVLFEAVRNLFTTERIADFEETKALGRRLMNLLRNFLRRAFLMKVSTIKTSVFRCIVYL
jgi:hypothetical protein